MKKKGTDIPQIQGSRCSINKEKGEITIDFVNCIEETLENANVVAQLTIPFSEYAVFAMSFVAGGLDIQKEMGIDLGFDLTKYNEEV